MNIQDLNRAFVYNRGLILQEKTQNELSRKQQEKAEIIRAEKVRRKKQALVNSIQSHFKNLQKFVKEVFSEPSELSQFLIEKVLGRSNFRSITRGKFLDCGPEKDDLPTLIPEAHLSVSQHIEQEYFDVIDLVRIESLSSEKGEYLIALMVPKGGAFGNKPRNDLRDAELIVYEHRCQGHGFQTDEENYLSHPPANVELRETLKYLKDLNIFCSTILKRYQNLVTS